MKQAFLEGNWIWKAPFGYKTVNKLLVQDEVQSKFVKEIFEKFATGLFSQSDILKFLKENNIKMTANTLSSLLRNPIYYGFLVNKKYSDIPVKGNFEAIIDEKTFFTVQAILKGNKALAVPHLRQNPNFPLKQFITCPYCNQPLTGDTPHRRKNQKYFYYRCYNKGCLANFNIPKDKLEQNFIKYLHKIKPNKRLLELFKRIISDVYNKTIRETKNNLKNLNNELSALIDKKNKLIDLYLDEKLSESAYNMKFAQIEENELNLKSKIAVNDIPQNDFDDCLNHACNILNNLDTFWLKSDIDTKQRLQKIIFPKGLRYDMEDFRNGETSILFNIIGTLSVPSIKMVPPSKFELLSTP